MSLENIMLNEKVWLLRVLGPAVCKMKEKGVGDCSPGIAPVGTKAGQ